MKSKLTVVMGYEFKKLVTSKGFIIGTILGPFLIIGMMLISSLGSLNQSRGEDPVKLALVSNGGNGAVDAVYYFLTNGGWEVERRSSTDGLDARVFAKELTGYIVAGPDYSFSYYAEDTGDIYVTSNLEDVISSCVVSYRLSEAGIDPQLVQELSAPTELKTFKLSETSDGAEETNATNDYLMRLLVPLCFAMLIYMCLLLYGQMIGRSVVNEKSSKIVDVLLSSVKATDLMLGKLLGVGLGGLIQYAVWMLFGFAGLKVTDMLDIQIAIPFIDFVWLTVFFLFGYVLYGTAYAAIGAASEDEQHMGNLAGPLVMFLILPILFLTSVSQNPHSLLAVILSVFPFTSPLIMLARLIQGGVPFWQLGLCFVLLFAAIWLMIKISAKIFRVGIMLSGKSFGFKDMKLWLTTKA